MGHLHAKRKFPTELPQSVGFGKFIEQRQNFFQVNIFFIKVVEYCYFIITNSPGHAPIFIHCMPKVHHKVKCHFFLFFLEQKTKQGSGMSSRLP